MESVLVIGVDGISGGNLAVALQRRFRVSGITSHSDIGIAGCDIISSKPHDAATIQQTLGITRPDWIIFCGAASVSCWDDPAIAERSFDDSLAIEWAQAARQAEIDFTMMSSDAVFTGPWMSHGEDALNGGATFKGGEYQLSAGFDWSREEGFRSGSATARRTVKNPDGSEFIAEGKYTRSFEREVFQGRLMLHNDDSNYMGIEAGYVNFLNSSQSPYYFGRALVGLEVPSIPARLEGAVSFSPSGTIDGTPLLNVFPNPTKYERATLRTELHFDGNEFQITEGLVIPLNVPEMPEN